MIKILYIEDEPFLAKIVKESLESRSFDVFHFENGKDIENIFVQVKPQICILDIMLPFKSGYEIAAEIRSIDPAIPILFLSAKDQTDDVIKGFETGGNDYVKKPFSMEELIVRINNLLRMSGDHMIAAQSNQIQISPSFVFYPQRYELVQEEKVKKLSHKESIILEMLCNERNNVIERKEILMSAWGDDSYFNSRNLDVYIRKLRKYLESDPNIQIITLKGIGYRFSVDYS